MNETKMFYVVYERMSLSKMKVTNNCHFFIDNIISSSNLTYQLIMLTLDILVDMILVCVWFDIFSYIISLNFYLTLFYFTLFFVAGLFELNDSLNASFFMGIICHISFFLNFDYSQGKSYMGPGNACSLLLKFDTLYL